MHAVDPLQRLRLLKRHAASLSDPAFHAELISIFTRLRDLHTTYVLPEPLRTRTAYLPFRMEEYFEGETPRYIVTEVKAGSEDASFKPGALVTHWNGIPIQRAVEINADREAGSNPEARYAQGLAAMTIRPLAMSLPPDEEWVVVTYRVGWRVRERRFDWQVFESGPPGDSPDPLAAANGLLLGLDAKAELERQARKLLFAPDAVRIARQVKQQTDPVQGGAPKAAEAVDFSVVSKLPDVFTFRKVTTPFGQFGYVRIHTFNVSDDTLFVEEFIRIAGLLPQNGLILDVRGNGGGNILAGERLLQVLTPLPVDPERFYFINSPLTLRICEAKPAWFADWRESIAQAVETGAPFSHGFSLRPVESYNDIGQKYQGPVVLVIDARCYSTTDIFSAGFQDHEIGRILGTSGATGAGGANVWSHGLLLTLLPSADSPFKPLPGNASFSVAVRRCTRVGKRSGALIEDLGVIPDAIHRTTRRDVLSGSIDLINRAGEILAAMPVQALAAEVQNTGATPSIEVTTKNIDRLDVLLNTRPFQSLDVLADATSIDLPPLVASPTTVELRGFRGDCWVASTRVHL
ncbi:MAG TPA: S41 family peptidase [Thermoanaerobaculia bacterium]|nr:S41 family peptidase [Thermoanaerobaculia bacterium]